MSSSQPLVEVVNPCQSSLLLMMDIPTTQSSLLIRTASSTIFTSQTFGQSNKCILVMAPPGCGEEGDIAGSVTLLRANKRICSVLNGPDQLFSELCTKDIGLRRNPVTRQGNKSEVWTRHFAQNWGAPYKFGVAVQSKSFDEAPPAILKALHRMLWGGNAAASSASEWIKNLSQVDPVPNRDVVFNELLSLGYMQDDRISYHDDGEKQLGPTVATLSLGSPAVMSFRPKRKAKIQTTYGKKGPKGDFVEVLVLPLYHGDLVVMHGTRIHRLYDHKVDPHGGRRFALTCRYIDPSSLNSKEEKEAATMNGQIPAEAFNSYRYLGDEVEADEPLSGKCQNAVSNALTRPT
ncbi:hypothetical protein VTK73DRAFT_5344 [Phialemonium thermophilum]|uniref:Fe2OG dioxygenase domain-containing protein n=1 Tax=Phialemonium thermophilum TaxID=223376 RepID=A0ABR3Y820_9PEZI